MNCANHPDTPVSSYCQFCGKPLCAECAHRIHNIVGCEPCLAARVSAAGVGSYGVNINDGKGFQYTATGPLPPGTQPRANWGTEPWVAFGLGWIPGVGAMYNGQFAKAIVHVFIFALLADLSDQRGFFGILLVGWVFYQVFDAYQTAIARRDGLPVPNPLGLNDIGQWFGARSHPPAQRSGNFAGNAPAANPQDPGVGTPFNPPATPAAGFTTPNPGFASMPPIPPGQADMPDLRRGVPTGAVVLIVLGVAFLLGNLGILSGYWIDRSWPLLLIGLGVFLVIRHSQGGPPGGFR